jgi:hypothetical protein
LPVRHLLRRGHLHLVMGLQWHYVRCYARSVSRIKPPGGGAPERRRPRLTQVAGKGNGTHLSIFLRLGDAMWAPSVEGQVYAERSGGRQQSHRRSVACRHAMAALFWTH